MLVVGFERRRPAGLSHLVIVLRRSRRARRCQDLARNQLLLRIRLAFSKQREVVMANMKTQPVDWEAFLAGFAGGKTDPAPHCSCP